MLQASSFMLHVTSILSPSFKYTKAFLKPCLMPILPRDLLVFAGIFKMLTFCGSVPYISLIAPLTITLLALDATLKTYTLFSERSVLFSVIWGESMILEASSEAFS